jgi:hypothetical protein
MSGTLKVGWEKMITVGYEIRSLEIDVCIKDEHLLLAVNVECLGRMYACISPITNK